MSDITYREVYEVCTTSALVLELVRLRVEDALADSGTYARHMRIGAVVTLLRERHVLDA